MRFYGSIQNRMEENRMFVDEIKVGTGVTEYNYSDRHPYEVIEVITQKNVIIRRLDHKHIGDGQMDNKWELVSNEENPTFRLVRRGNYWYFASTLTQEEVDKIDDPMQRLRLAVAGFDLDAVKAKGKQTKYTRANVSFGTAQYYYDYEF